MVSDTDSGRDIWELAACQFKEAFFSFPNMVLSRRETLGRELYLGSFELNQWYHETARQEKI